MGVSSSRTFAFLRRNPLDLGLLNCNLAILGYDENRLHTIRKEDPFRTLVMTSRGNLI
jgi:hypothetical protein